MTQRSDMDTNTQVALPDAFANQGIAAEHGVLAAQTGALFGRYDVPVANELLDPDGFPKIPADHPLQGFRRDRPLAKQAGEPGNGLVIDGSRPAAQAFAQGIKTQAAEGEYQR